jgi:hypothetical protein
MMIEKIELKIPDDPIEFLFASSPYKQSSLTREGLQRTRGIQKLCAKCRNDCKVLASVGTLDSSFICKDFKDKRGRRRKP